MTGRRWRTVAIALIVLTVIRGVPWFIDNLGVTGGILVGFPLSLIALMGAICTPLKPDPPTTQEPPP